MFFSSFSSEFLQNSGLGSFETFFDGTDKLLEGAETVKRKVCTLNAIAEVTSEFIANASQDNLTTNVKELKINKRLRLVTQVVQLLQ
jgi:hypothetical protein